MNKKTSDSTCSCARSSYPASEISNTNINIYAYHDARKPHTNPRKKYKKDDLVTTGAQCNYASSRRPAADTRGFQVQCDMPSPNQHKSDTWACEREAGPPVTKHASAPGICAMRMPNNTLKSHCVCQTKCSRECQQLKMVTGVENAKKKINSLCTQYNCKMECSEIQPNSSIAPLASLSVIPKTIPHTEASAECVECQCSGVCNMPCMIKKEGIKNLFSPEEFGSGFAKGTCVTCDCTGKCNKACDEIKRTRDPSQPKICNPCACTSLCTHECSRKHLKPNPEDICLCTTHCQTGCSKNPLLQMHNVSAACELCDCIGSCNEECKLKMEQKKQAKIEGREEATQEARKICEECVCNAVCIPECEMHRDDKGSQPIPIPVETKTEQKEEIPKPPAPIIVPDINPEEPDKIANDPEPISQTETEPQENIPKPQEDILEPPAPIFVPEVPNPEVPEPIVNAPKPIPQTDIEPKKAIVEPPAPIREPDPRPKAAEPNINAPEPIPQTEPKSKVCDACACTDKCSEECEENKKECVKKVRISDELPQEQQPIEPYEDETYDVATQVRGIIENFNDQNITLEMPDAPILREDKEISSCNVAGEVICENCLCDPDMCNSKCAAVREIKSIGGFPPATTVCKSCSCVNKCTIKCESKKSGLSCKTKDDNPIVCSSPEQRWIPCVNCANDDPCSPECRERRALAFGRQELETKHKPIHATHGTEPEEEYKPRATPRTVNLPVQTSNERSNVRDRTTSTAEAEIFKKKHDASGEPHSGVKEKTAYNQTIPEETDSATCSCPATGKQQENPECSLCKKLRGYISNMFQKDKGVTDRYKPHDEDTICYCPKESSSKLEKKTASYTERLQAMMGQMHSACDEAEFAALPYIKAQSAYEINVHNQQEAIITLLQKCRQKDTYIEALIGELLGRSESLAFDKLRTRLAEPCTNAPDFNRSLIANALNTRKKRTSICGADLRNFEITCIKRIGVASLLIKWTCPRDNRVIGYELYVDAMLKFKVHSKECICAILDALDFSTTITIEVFAMMKNGRATPSAIAYYAK